MLFIQKGEWYLQLIVVLYAWVAKHHMWTLLVRDHHEIPKAASRSAIALGVVRFNHIGDNKDCWRMSLLMLGTCPVARDA